MSTHVPALAGIARGLLDFALPPACAVCSGLVSRDGAGLVCDVCWARILTLGAPRCERCGHPLAHPKHRCRWCPLLPPFVRAVRSVAWVPGGAAGGIVHALKYDGWHGVAHEMAARMARLAWPDDVVRERAALVAVPLASTRLRERGFNQSEMLARALAPRWCVEVLDGVVERTRSTDSQTRLTPEQRLRNVSGAFRTTPGAAARLDGMHIVLVDDVVTTAATLNECAAALMHGGARIISYVTFGRARTDADRS